MQLSGQNPPWPESPAIAASLDRHGETANERRQRISAELVHLLYAQAPLGIASTVIVAGLTAVAHWGLVSATIVFLRARILLW